MWSARHLQEQKQLAVAALKPQNTHRTPAWSEGEWVLKHMLVWYSKCPGSDRGMSLAGEVLCATAWLASRRWLHATARTAFQWNCSVKDAYTGVERKPHELSIHCRPLCMFLGTYEVGESYAFFFIPGHSYGRAFSVGMPNFNPWIRKHLVTEQTKLHPFSYD